MAETEEGKPKFNVSFLTSQAGILRLAEALVALAGLISASIGSCSCDGKVGFFLFVVITTFIEAVFIIVVIVFRFDARITNVNIPLTLFFNDGVCIAFYFLSSLLMMLSIGQCHYMVTARIFATLFSITNFLVLISLFYIEFTWWRSDGRKVLPEEQIAQTSTTNGTTVNESSPTVLTLE